MLFAQRQGNPVFFCRDITSPIAGGLLLGISRRKALAAQQF
jgi:hypothetical protein